MWNYQYSWDKVYFHGPLSRICRSTSCTTSRKRFRLWFRVHLSCTSPNTRSIGLARRQYVGNQSNFSLCCVTIGSPRSTATDTSCPPEPPLKRCDQCWGSLHAQATAGAGRLQREASIEQQHARLRIPTEDDVHHGGARRFSPARPVFPDDIVSIRYHPGHVPARAHRLGQPGILAKGRIPGRAKLEGDPLHEGR